MYLVVFFSLRKLVKGESWPGGLVVEIFVGGYRCESQLEELEVMVGLPTAMKHAMEQEEDALKNLFVHWQLAFVGFSWRR